MNTTKMKCKMCSGTGYMIDMACPYCKGTGRKNNE